MDIADVFLMKEMLASLEPVALLALCVLVLRHGTVGSGVELHRPGVTVAVRRVPVLRYAQRTGTQAYFASKVFGGVCGEAVAAAGAVGLVWTVYEMACFVTLLPSLRWSDLPVIMPRQVLHGGASDAVLRRLGAPVLGQCRLTVQTVPKTVWRFVVVQKTIENSQLQIIHKVLLYVVAQRQIPMVLTGGYETVLKNCGGSAVAVHRQGGRGPC